MKMALHRVTGRVCSSETGSRSSITRKAVIMLGKKEMPPMRGMAFLCTFRSLGIS